MKQVNVNFILHNLKLYYMKQNRFEEAKSSFKEISFQHLQDNVKN